MGYVPQRKVYRLQFEDEELEGLEVRARSVPLGAFLDMVALMDIDSSNIGPEEARNLGELFERFCGVLVGWNLEEPEGVPVPATLEGLKRQDVDFALQVIRAWVAALSQIPDFLPPPSSNGARSLELQMPMEPLSPNPGS